MVQRYGRFEKLNSVVCGGKKPYVIWKLCIKSIHYRTIRPFQWQKAQSRGNRVHKNFNHFREVLLAFGYFVLSNYYVYTGLMSSVVALLFAWL